MGYKMDFLSRVVFSASLFLCLNLFSKINYPDFDQSMLRVNFEMENIDKEFNQKNLKFYKERNQNLLSFFKKLYQERSKEALDDLNQEAKIPKIVHQIWLGSSVPEVYKKWMKTWSELAGFEYYLWTDEEVKDFKMYNRDLFDATSNLGEKSDILRLEILRKYGGVYVDLDYECLKPEVFNELHRGYDFYIGFEPLEHGFTHKFNMIKVCNAIIGSSPYHPLIEDLITNLKANFLAYQKCCTAIQKTGPSYLTRIICEHELLGFHAKRNIYLPCSFFYTTSEPETRYLFAHPETPAVIAEETAGFHYWYGSWWREASFEGTITKKEKTNIHEEKEYEATP